MKQLVFTLLFFIVVGLSAQQPAQVDYVSTVALSAAFVHSAIQTEGSLALFGVAVNMLILLLSGQLSHQKEWCLRQIL